MNLSDEVLFAALAHAAKRQVSKFNVQDLANMAWVYATMNLADKRLFTALARGAEWRLSQFNIQGLANTTWAFATVI